MWLHVHLRRTTRLRSLWHRFLWTLIHVFPCISLQNVVNHLDLICFRQSLKDVTHIAILNLLGSLMGPLLVIIGYPTLLRTLLSDHSHLSLSLICLHDPICHHLHDTPHLIKFCVLLLIPYRFFVRDERSFSVHDARVCDFTQLRILFVVFWWSWWVT